MKLTKFIKSFGAIVATGTILLGQVMPTVAAESTQIKVASVGSDAQVWKYIADLDEVKQAGFEIKVEEINGGVELNNAVADGVVDVNAFQSIGYMDSFNKEAKNKLVPIGTTYIEPMGIYSKRHKTLAELPEGAVVTIPESPVNGARALRLLENAGLIKLKADFDEVMGTANDIVENSKKLEFKAIEDTTAPRSLEDVDASIIGNTIALEGGLNVLKDALYKEEVNDSTKSRVNVLAVKAGREKDEKLLKLVEFYHLPKVQEYVTKQFDGTKVEVKKEIKEVWSGQ